MKIAFLHSDKPRERVFADAFLRGAAKHGHQTASLSLATPPGPDEFDVVAMVGVKSRELFRRYQLTGGRIIYLDKGYSRQKSKAGSRGWEYWRVSIDAHHPTDRLAGENFPSDRFDNLELEVAPWRKCGDHILLAGSSAKYHAFYGLKDPTAFGKHIVREIRERTEMPIIYRPKPSWKEAVPLFRTEFSAPPATIYDVLKGAHAMVTHGSNTCWEAMLCGIPAVVLGPGVSRDISSISISEIEAPRLASEEERLRLLRNLAYWQWSAKEFASGQAWEMLGEQLHAV